MRRLILVGLTCALGSITGAGPAPADTSPPSCQGDSCWSWVINTVPAPGGGGATGPGGGGGGDGGSGPALTPDQQAAQQILAGIGCLDIGLTGGGGNVGVTTTTNPACQKTPAGPGAPAISPRDVLYQAMAKLKLRKPTIGTAPCRDAGCSGYVGVPVWLWTPPGDWQPQTVSATGGPYTVTITARITAVDWSMGDGHTITCTTPGTKFTPAYGFRDSPDCGYRYSIPSTHSANHDARYTLTATARYAVEFGGAVNGRTTTATISSTTVRIGELQAIVVR